MAAGIGFVLMFICVKMDYHWFRRLAGLGYIAAFVLCLAVNFAGKSSHGSSRWLQIGSFSFQPSELAKVAMILYLAAVISKRPKAMRSFGNNVKVLLTVVPVVAVIAYNNLSTAIIIMGIAVIMVFVSSPRYVPFVAVGGAAILGAGLFVLGNAGNYRLERIQIWLHPEDYDKGYQTLQGLYAIGSGGLFGKGLG
jgi:cell division protein FtsW